MDLVKEVQEIKRYLSSLRNLINNTTGGTGGADEAAIRTLTGTATGTTNLGSFSGNTINDSTTIKIALQELETKVDGTVVVSTDADNAIIVGSDGGAFFNPIDQTVVDDIGARDALGDLTSGDIVYVIDATGDATVDLGAALYVYDGAAWQKIAEFESLDATTANITTGTLTSATSNRTVDLGINSLNINSTFDLLNNAEIDLGTTRVLNTVHSGNNTNRFYADTVTSGLSASDVVNNTNSGVEASSSGHLTMYSNIGEIQMGSLAAPLLTTNSSFLGGEFLDLVVGPSGQVRTVSKKISHITDSAFTTVVTPVVVGNPTVAEMQTYIDSKGDFQNSENVGKILFYTGTDSDSDPKTHVYYLDGEYQIVELVSPAATTANITEGTLNPATGNRTVELAGNTLDFTTTGGTSITGVGISNQGFGVSGISTNGTGFMSYDVAAATLLLQSDTSRIDITNATVLVTSDTQTSITTTSGTNTSSVITLPTSSEVSSTDGTELSKVTTTSTGAINIDSSTGLYLLGDTAGGNLPMTNSDVVGKLLARTDVSGIVNSIDYSRFEVLTGTVSPSATTTTAWYEGQLYLDTVSNLLYRADRESTDPDTSPNGSAWILIEPKTNHTQSVAAIDWTLGTPNTLSIPQTTHLLGTGYKNVRVFDASNNEVIIPINVDPATGDITISTTGAVFACSVFISK